MFLIGGNPAEAHPVSMLHLLKRQGAEQRAADRVRPALHAHRRARRRVRALPLRHRHRADLGHPLAHLRERLGGQGVHPPSASGAWTQVRDGGRRSGRPRRSSGSPACPASSCSRVAKTLADQQARHRDLVHGRHAAHDRQQQRARLLHPAAGARQHRRGRRRHQHLPRPRQRAGRHRLRRRARHPARLLRPGRGRLEALVRASGTSTTTGCSRRFDGQGADGGGGHPGLALGRRRARGQGEHRRSPTPSRPWSSGAMRPTRRPAGPTSRRRWRSSTCWSSSTRIRPSAAVLHDRTDGVYLLPAADAVRDASGSVHRLATARCSGARR